MELGRVMELKGLPKKDQTDILASLGLVKAAAGGPGIAAVVSSSAAPIGSGVSNITAGMREGSAKINTALMGGMGKFLSAAKAATTGTGAGAKK